MEPLKLNRLVQGELDWIVMKCLEKDRNRRYETASGLAADIERYLHDEPVEASPPSATYKLRKLAYKYRGPLGAVTGVAILLIAATVFSSWQAIRATRATAVALAEKQRADQEAMTAKRVTESFQEMLGLMDPDAASYSMMALSAVRLQVMLGLVRADKIRGPDYTILQLIDDFAENVEGKLADEPAAAAQLHATIGGAYAIRGNREKARKHLERALELARSVYGEEHDKYADFLVMYSRPDGSDPAQRTIVKRTCAGRWQSTEIVELVASASFVRFGFCGGTLASKSVLGTPRRRKRSSQQFEKLSPRRPKRRMSNSQKPPVPTAH